MTQMIKFKRLIMKSPQFKFNIDINTDITIICGDSGTGKTLLKKMIEHQSNIEDSELFDNVIVYNRGISIPTIRNKLVYIDDFDAVMCEEPEIINDIFNNKENQYIIIFRGYTSIKIPVFCIGELKLDKTKGEYFIEYLSPTLRRRYAK